MEINTGALRNIEKEILRECSQRNIDVHENFLNFYLKLLALDPKWGISTNMMTNRMDVQNFIKHVTGELQDLKKAGIVTLRMQFYFDYNYKNRLHMVKTNRVSLMSKIDSLKNEILDQKSLELIDDVHLIQKRMVYYVTLLSGLGNPSVEEVYNEVFAALGSILNEEELQEFVTLPKHQKEEQLLEYTRLVTGIRLFNKDCDKGGEGMENLPKLLTEGIAATNNDLKKILHTVMDEVNLLTTGLDCAFVTEIDERGHYILVCKPPEGCQQEDAEYLIDFLILYRQYEVFIRKLLESVDNVQNESLQIFEELKSSLLKLHEVVGHRIAIPVNQVFPHFIRLSEIWFGLQDLAVLLAKINQIALNLGQYAKLANLNEVIAEAFLPRNQEPMTDVERLEISSASTFELTDDLRSLSKKFDHVNAEYLGFCPWKLVRSKGALLPGNPHLGVFPAMNMHFVCSSVKAAKAFTKFPERYVMQVIQLARNKPQLVAFLNLDYQLRLVDDVKNLVTELPPAPLTDTKQNQTVTHIVETFIDKDYMWNIWDHKRRALQLANLTHCKTVSCQTEKTFYRFGARTQTQEKRDKNDQTKKDNYSNVPKPSTFMYGLRGRKDDKQVVVDLTRPVEE